MSEVTKNKIRLLNADEIDVRIGATTQNGKAQLLLYKDARCDMTILDEVYGSNFWQDKYERIGDNLFCSVGVYNDEIKEWIWKSSNGVESQGNDEGNNIKGEASDAFKRACFMLGIGRELYKWKGLWIDYDKEKDRRARFYVKDIGYDEVENPSYIVINKIVGGKETTVLNSKNKSAKATSNKEKASNEDLSNTPSKNTQNDEKLRKNDSRVSEGVIMTDEELENAVKTKNRTLWYEIIANMQQIAYDYEVSSEEFDEISKSEPMDYFVNKLKMPTKGKNFVNLELLEEGDEKLIKTNIEVVLNDEFYDNFTKYLKNEVFRPF